MDSRALSGMFLIMLVVAYLGLLVPTAFAYFDGDSTVYITQEEGIGETVTADVTAEIIELNATPPYNATVEIRNLQTGDSETLTNLTEGNTTEITLGSDNITVDPGPLVSVNAVQIAYTFPPFLNWPVQSESMLRYMLLFLLALPVLAITGIVMWSF